jgi:hypothetical protein
VPPHLRLDGAPTVTVNRERFESLVLHWARVTRRGRFSTCPGPSPGYQIVGSYS